METSQHIYCSNPVMSTRKSYSLCGKANLWQKQPSVGVLLS